MGISLPNSLNTIRAKLLAACLGFALFMGGVAVFTLQSLEESNELVARTFKKPFMAINYAHRAHIAFLWMDGEVNAARRGADRKTTARHLSAIARYHALFKEDIAIARSRSISQQAVIRSDAIANLVERWVKIVETSEIRRFNSAIATELESLRRLIDRDFDQLSNIIAGDGFVIRRRSVDVFEHSIVFNMIAFCTVLLIGLTVTIILGRSILHPLEVAVNVARGLAEGELQKEIPKGGAGETGALLAAMKVMQDNLRRRMDHEVALRESAQARLVDAIESSPEGVILTDANNKIVVANSQITRFLPQMKGLFEPGDDAGDAIYEANCRGLFDPSVGDPDGQRIRLENARRQDRSTSEIKLADGRWLHIGRSRTTDGGTVAFWSDITELKERESALVQARNDAESANRTKSEFLANMSHELRTPLNAIIGFADILSGQFLGPIENEKYVGYADGISESGVRLLTVINDILDLSKSEAGRLSIDCGPVSVPAVIESCSTMMEQEFDQKRIAFKSDLSDDIQPVLADADRLTQVLCNLLSNSVKFTMPGGKVILTVENAASGFVDIRVSDTGIGMRQEDINVALEPFHQLDMSLSRSYEGIGLGLPLARKLVELQGGSMSIESELEVGTTVTVRLVAEKSGDAAVLPDVATGSR